MLNINFSTSHLCFFLLQKSDQMSWMALFWELEQKWYGYKKSMHVFPLLGWNFPS